MSEFTKEELARDVVKHVDDFRERVERLSGDLLELEQSSFVWRGWEFR